MIPEGEHVGKPVKLAQFQKDFILAVYDNPNTTDTAILSIARKNAKTGLIAFLLLAHLLVSGVAVQNSRIISGALSREQAAEVYNLASKCIQLSPELSKLVRIVPSSKKIIALPMNVEYQAISAEGKTAHGKSPVLAILDEVGQIVGPRSDFVDAITTAQGAYASPLLIYISTQAASDGDMFSLLIDDAQKNKPAKTICHVYSADPESDLMDEKQWLKANPALGLFRSKEDMKKQAEKASRMPSFEATFRNLNLNQRVSSSSPFINKNAWMACNGDPLPLSEYTRIYAGLDLSAKTDLTAMCLIGIDDKTGEYGVHPFFWTPEKGLVDRAKNDHAPYDIWARDGFLRKVPGATVDLEYVAKDILDIISGLPVVGIAYDRWRMDILKKEFERAGVPDLPLTEWGQGFKDMSPALDALESLILNSKLKHGAHPVLTMCAANAVLSKDPAGNRKLDKGKTSGRIDGMVALAMAAGLAERAGNNSTLDDAIADPIFI